MVQDMEEQLQSEDTLRALPDRPPRHCPDCGARVAEGAKTCLMCGTALTEEASLAPVAELRAPTRRIKPLHLVILLGVAALILGGAAVLGWLLSQGEVEIPLPTPSPTLEMPLVPSPTATATPTPTPTLTPTPDVSPTPMPPQSYVVKEGDTLGGIALQFDITVQELKDFNNLTSDLIGQGQTLYIPGAPPDPTPTPTLEPGQATPTLSPYVTHIVQSGEVLSTIAEKYDISVAAIRAANNIPANSDTIRPGDALVIPMPTPTPEGPAPIVEGLESPAPQLAYASPTLLYPPRGATFEGAEAIIVLQWASVGILAPGEYYQVALTLPSAEGPQTTWTYVRSTAWRVPAELLPPAQVEDRSCSWQVAIVRQSETDAEDYTVIGPPGLERNFYWTVARP